MKKTWAIILTALLLMAALCACASQEAPTNAPTDPENGISASQRETSDAGSDGTEPEESDTPDTTAAAPGTPSNTGSANREIASVEISFDYTHMSTHASNQIAIWIEDEDGAVVKTLIVTDFTAARRGYRNRDAALSHWVAAADPESKPDTDIDAISSATPSAGHCVYTWDMTNDTGARVSDGIYYVRVEGTLYWESNILFTARIDTADFTPGEQNVSVERSQPDVTENETMLQNVRVSIINQ